MQRYFKIFAFNLFPTHTYMHIQIKKHTEIAGEARRFKRNHGAREYQAFKASRSENTKVNCLNFSYNQTYYYTIH